MAGKQLDIRTMFQRKRPAPEDGSTEAVQQPTTETTHAAGVTECKTSGARDGDDSGASPRTKRARVASETKENLVPSSSGSSRSASARMRRRRGVIDSDDDDEEDRDGDGPLAKRPRRDNTPVCTDGGDGKLDDQSAEGDGEGANECTDDKKTDIGEGEDQCAVEKKIVSGPADDDGRTTSEETIVNEKAAPAQQASGETSTPGAVGPAMMGLFSSLTREASLDYVKNRSAYHVVDDAGWASGDDVPYLAVAKVFAAIEAESGRLKITELLTNLLRSVAHLTPQDLTIVLYVCVNRVAPDYEGTELGIGDAILLKALSESTGRQLAAVKKAYAAKGDLGLVAESCRTTQQMLKPPKPLSVRRVFETLRSIALVKGNGMQQKKVDMIKRLLVSCRGPEAKYVIRSLSGKLRIGLKEATVLVALSNAVVLTPPTASPPVLDASASDAALADKTKLAAALADASALVKQAYSELPNYQRLSDALLQRPLADLPSLCCLTPGIPVKPMLAKPTNGIQVVLKRFEGIRFTCEYKYDGERAQIHRLPDGRIEIFSRNSENMTEKYPDLLAALPDVMTDATTSFIIDCEAVAYDPVKGNKLPFQVLSKRARKDVKIADIKIPVCLYAFDLLYLNGKSMLQQPFAERRQALHQAFLPVKDKFQFAVHMEGDKPEDLEEFLNESIKDHCEGLMVKTIDVDATYTPSKRSFNWLKIKKDYLKGLTDSLDLVPIGGYLGTGKRTGVYGGYLMACYDPENEEYQSVCKIGTGLSDEFLASSFAQLNEHRIEQPRSYYVYGDAVRCDVWFDAKFVWEILAADLSISPVHKAAVGMVDETKGVALRFPRFIQVREDKSPEDATSAEQVAEMYRNQGLAVQSDPATSLQDDDDMY